MKYGLDVPTIGEYCDPQKLAELAVEAEAAGWDGFFVWDGLLEIGGADDPIIDPWITLTAIAMKTRRIRFGAFMTPLVRGGPWQVARQATSVDRLSYGRLIFGAGLGSQELGSAPLGDISDPKFRAEKLDEGLAILDGLWSGDSFSFRGTYYQISDIKLAPKPIQSPRIPVWIGGAWPYRKAFRRAARWDGTYLMPRKMNGEQLTADDVRDIADFVKLQRQSLEAFDIVVPGETPADAQAGAKIVQPFLQAGATWWIEYEASRNGFAEYRKRILSGPPRVT